MIEMDSHAWKMAGLCAAVGFPYDGSQTAGDFEGKTLTVKLRQQKNTQSGNMENAVDTYIPKKAGANVAKPIGVDLLPF